MGEFKSLIKMEKELEKKYAYKVIAMHKGKVIAAGDSYKEVLEKSSKLVGKKPVLIHRIAPAKKAAAIL
ncbi:MAG: hypothetical protein COS84_00730 [Armatimonadetes bacterium CG07_land_8_20_14_0_80_40_9]|nr:MAG: hypothetical protein COS84_00730 [Armatimonadetes bacterium CG07_land_8_20_14_0_80_40_9]